MRVRRARSTRLNLANVPEPGPPRYTPRRRRRRRPRRPRAPFSPSWPRAARRPRLRRASNGSNAQNGRSPVDALALRLESQYPETSACCARTCSTTSRCGPASAFPANPAARLFRGECCSAWPPRTTPCAGLTPKLRDTAILCDMLTYKVGDRRAGRRRGAGGGRTARQRVRERARRRSRARPAARRVPAGRYGLAPDRTATTPPSTVRVPRREREGEMGGENVERGP